MSGGERWLEDRRLKQTSSPTSGSCAKGRTGLVVCSTEGKRTICSIGVRGHLQGRFRSQALDIDVGVLNVKVQISGSSVFLPQSFYMMSVQ